MTDMMTLMIASAPLIRFHFSLDSFRSEAVLLLDWFAHHSSDDIILRPALRRCPLLSGREWLCKPWFTHTLSSTHGAQVSTCVQGRVLTPRSTTSLHHIAADSIGVGQNADKLRFNALLPIFRLLCPNPALSLARLLPLPSCDHLIGRFRRFGIISSLAFMPPRGPCLTNKHYQ